MGKKRQHNQGDHILIPVAIFSAIVTFIIFRWRALSEREEKRSALLEKGSQLLTKHKENLDSLFETGSRVLTNYEERSNLAGELLPDFSHLGYLGLSVIGLVLVLGVTILWFQPFRCVLARITEAQVVVIGAVIYYLAKGINRTLAQRDYPEFGRRFLVYFGTGARIALLVSGMLMVFLPPPPDEVCKSTSPTLTSTWEPATTLTVWGQTLGLIPRPAWDTYYEENDVQEQAYPLEFGKVYVTYPDDPDDWYYVILEQAASLRVHVTDYVARGQLVVYESALYQNPPRRLLASDGRGLPTMIIPNLIPEDLKDLGPGRYYIRIASDENERDTWSIEQPYTLVVTYEP